VSGSALAVVLCVFAGLAGAVQVAVMSGLGDRIGVAGAIAFATVVSAVLAIAALIVLDHSLGAFARAAHQPLWLLLGGVIGLFILLGITYGGSQIGIAATVGILIAGQLAMGAAIDRFGLFGAKQIALPWPRLLGIVLLGAGAALSLRK
jgi:bacterial/archaeal transporter family-2 protein